MKAVLEAKTLKNAESAKKSILKEVKKQSGGKCKKTEEKTKKTKTVKATATRPETSNDDTSTSCLYCSALWCMSIETWIQCQACSEWAHRSHTVCRSY